MDVSKGCLALSDAKWEGPNISSASTPILIERGESRLNVCISTEFADLIEKSIPSFSYFGNESPRFFISTIKLAQSSSSPTFSFLRRQGGPGQGANLLETRGRDVLSDRAIEVS